MVVDLDKLGLSFYLWHHFLWSRDIDDIELG